MSDQATAIGVTVIPTPITDMGSDLWFVHKLAMSHLQFTSGVGFDGNSGTRVDIDSKAMRKVDIGQDMVVVSEIPATISDGTTLLLAGRMLVKVN